jgi:lysophospholipase L1-like esterase
MSRNPKVVSVELGANDLLGARFGVWLPGIVVPIEEWKPQYAQVVEAISDTKHVLLVGLIHDAMDFPGFRTGAELYAAQATFAPLNVKVGDDCGSANATNVLFVPVRVAAAAAEGARRPRGDFYTMNCFNAPSESRVEDYVLTAGEISQLNTQLSQMNAFIKAQAEDRGFAHFELEELYGVANVKPLFNATLMVASPSPFGPLISLDGFHPSAEGARILANAAARALNKTYAMGLPQSSVVTGRPIIN